MARGSRSREIDDAPAAPITAEGLRETILWFRYVLPYRRKFLAAQVCLGVSTLTGLSFPFLTGQLIDRAQGASSHGIGAAILSGANLGVGAITLVLVSVLVIQAICSLFQTYWLAEVGERSSARLRQDVYAHLIGLPMAFFSQRRVGELASHLAADLSLIQGMLIGSIPQFLGQVMLLAGGVVLITITSVRLTLLMLATLPIAIGMAVVFGRTARKISRQTQDKLAETNVIVEETLQGIASVKAFGNEGLEIGRYRSGVGALIDVVLRGAWYQGVFGSFISVVMFGSMFLVIWYAARLVEARELTFGQMTQFLLYTMYIGGAMGQFARLYGELQRTLGATQRVRELLRESREQVALEPAGLPLPPSAEPLPRTRIAGDIAFERVTFSYPARPEVAVLRDLSLHAKAGERVALVGPSGAGKSTIVSLLLRFYDPDRGRIIVGGRDARDYPLDQLRAQMAIVPQDVLLFGGTIAENIAYGRPGSNSAEIESAARRANAHEFIVGFPEGYQTLVGDRGVKLSGGQRQRVAIARAILKDPAILILDEATSSLDSESESLVQQALDGLMRGRTSVIIAHRLATVRRADRIFVVKEGQVVESGTHEQLVSQTGGLYRTLSELQFDMVPSAVTGGESALVDGVLRPQFRASG
jgi:ATP-binding cassette subfamily B protein